MRLVILVTITTVFGLAPLVTTTATPTIKRRNATTAVIWEQGLAGHVLMADGLYKSVLQARADSDQFFCIGSAREDCTALNGGIPCFIDGSCVALPSATDQPFLLSDGFDSSTHAAIGVGYEWHETSTCGDESDEDTFTRIGQTQCVSGRGTWRAVLGSTGA